MVRGSVCLLALLATLVGATPVDAQEMERTEPQRCGGPPVAASGDRDPLALDVRVLLDGVRAEQAMPILEQVRTAYAQLGIDLVVAIDGAGGSVFAHAAEVTDAEELIELARDHFGGERPAGADVVYVMTARDLTAGSSTAVAGRADCVGGIAQAARAFAVGEVQGVQEIAMPGLPPLTTAIAAKVAAHEVAHLLGAEHHYSNCIEGVWPDAVVEMTPCTLLFNDVALQSLRFSLLEGWVARGYAERYG